jgi:putative membrane protein
MRVQGSRALRQASIAALISHVALIIFSTAAMLTILSGPPSAALEREPAATIMRVAWKSSGPTYVVLGALAAVLHAMWAFGVRRGIGLFVAAAGIALGTELLGTSTGFPFGDYAYTSLLGYRIMGQVPFPIPISWFYMLYCALAMCARLLSARDDERHRWVWAIGAALMLTAWDVAMDPAMVQTAHWVWQQPGFFYGMPLSNWIGWFFTGLIIARVMLAIAPPTHVATRNAGEWLPLALYAANGIMPLAICLRDGLWWAAALGSLAMAAPVVLSLRAARQRAASNEPRGAFAPT